MVKLPCSSERAKNWIQHAVCGLNALEKVQPCDWTNVAEPRQTHLTHCFEKTNLKKSWNNNYSTSLHFIYIKKTKTVALILMWLKWAQIHHLHTADKDSIYEISPCLAAKEKINGVKVKITIKYSLLGRRWKKIRQRYAILLYCIHHVGERVFWAAADGWWMTTFMLLLPAFFSCREGLMMSATETSLSGRIYSMTGSCKPNNDPLMMLNDGELRRTELQ